MIFYSEEAIQAAIKQYDDEHRDGLGGKADPVACRLVRLLMPAVIRGLCNEMNAKSKPDAVTVGFAHALAAVVSTVAGANFEPGSEHGGAHKLVSMIDEVVCMLFQSGSTKSGVPIFAETLQ